MTVGFVACVALVGCLTTPSGPSAQTATVLTANPSAAVKFSDTLAACDVAVATGTAPAVLANALRSVADVPKAREGVIKVREGTVFASVVLKDDLKTIRMCTIETAKYVNGKWRSDIAWDAVKGQVFAHVDKVVPSSAINVFKKPDPLDLHLFQRQYVHCKRDQYWWAGPSYMSDGGHVFPVSIDWRMDGAVASYATMIGLFGQTREKYC